LFFYNICILIINWIKLKNFLSDLISILIILSIIYLYQRLFLIIDKKISIILKLRILFKLYILPKINLNQDLFYIFFYITIL
jgi:hypothetical protein